MSMWWISKMVISQDKTIAVILDMMMDIATQQLKLNSPKVVSINLKKT